MLVRAADAYVVDAGDGAVQRLAQAGVSLNAVRVITHISPPVVTAELHAQYKRDIAKNFRGPVEIADDLDRF